MIPNATDPAQLILQRREIRRSFEKWCAYRMAKIGQAPAQHHLVIIRAIEKLLRNELILPNGKVAKKLQIRTPPGSAKSTYTSKLLPAWFCNSEQHPFGLMLACSYSYTLIEGFGKVARNYLEEDENVLGVTLSKTSSSAGEWRVRHNEREDGGYFCAGVGSGIAGHRALLGLIDDFLGTEEEASSDRARKKVYDWYRNDFKPRLVPGAWEIIICNHRHEEDLVGLLEKEEGDEWYIISIPMEAEDNDILGRQKGQRLWPEYFTEEMVRDAKKNRGAWAGLYQQRPAPEDGDFFLRENILEYRPSDLPTNLRIYATSDWALRKGDRNDSTVHLLGGVDESGRLWILPNWFWDKSDTLEGTNKMLEMQKEFKPTYWWHGKENITGAIGPFVTTLMREKGIYVNIIELSEATDKAAKAAAIGARMKAKMVMFPGFHPDWDKALHELLSFPNGAHDDFVDALAKFGQGLDLTTRPGGKAKATPTEIPDQVLDGAWLVKSSKAKERNRLRELQLN